MSETNPTDGEKNLAWARGRTAGKQRRGMASNPFSPADPLSEEWDAGYKSAESEGARK